MRWCAAAQVALLETQWPEALLKLPDCAPETEPLFRKLIFKGLRIRMGASFGSGLIRKPLNTGQPAALTLPPTEQKLLHRLLELVSLSSRQTGLLHHCEVATVSNSDNAGLFAGRADYFGTVSNLAARVAGLAAPGQILVEGREAFRREKDWRRKSDMITLPPDPLGSPKGMPGGNTDIVLEQIGYYLLKVGLQLSCLHSECIDSYMSIREEMFPPSTALS